MSQHFGPATMDFKCIVPENYEHETQINTFKKRFEDSGSIISFSRELNDENFLKVTNRLVPGKEYRVRIFPILTVVTSSVCLEFLKEQGAVLVGAQGLTLLCDIKKAPHEFPQGKRVVSFDKKTALLAEPRSHTHRVPYVYHNSFNGDRRFLLGYFEFEWCNEYCIVCFNET